MNIRSIVVVEFHALVFVSRVIKVNDIEDNRSRVGLSDRGSARLAANPNLHHGSTLLLLHDEDEECSTADAYGSGSDDTGGDIFLSNPWKLLDILGSITTSSEVSPLSLTLASDELEDNRADVSTGLYIEGTLAALPDPRLTYRWLLQENSNYP